MTQPEQQPPPPPPPTATEYENPEVPDTSGLPMGGKGVEDDAPSPSDEEIESATTATNDLPMGGKGREDEASP